MLFDCNANIPSIVERTLLTYAQAHTHYATLFAPDPEQFIQQLLYHTECAKSL
jgi:hypothetical protein